MGEQAASEATQQEQRAHAQQQLLDAQEVFTAQKECTQPPLGQVFSSSEDPASSSAGTSATGAVSAQCLVAAAEATVPEKTLDQTADAVSNVVGAVQACSTKEVTMISQETGIEQAKAVVEAQDVA